MTTDSKPRWARRIELTVGGHIRLVYGGACYWAEVRTCGDDGHLGALLLTGPTRATKAAAWQALRRRFRSVARAVLDDQWEFS